LQILERNYAREPSTMRRQSGEISSICLDNFKHLSSRGMAAALVAFVTHSKINSPLLPLNSMLAQTKHSRILIQRECIALGRPERFLISSVTQRSAGVCYENISKAEQREREQEKVFSVVQ
jgi:hypothetical protein